MNNTKSILAETLAEIQEIKEGISKNANHVLKSTLKEDLEAIVRKGLNEADEDQPNDMVGDGIPTDLGSDNVDSTEMSDDLGIDPTAGVEGEPGEPELIDLTDKADDEVIQHFNLMSPADEIEVVQTPEGGVQININPSTEEGGSTEEVPAAMDSIGGEDETTPEGGDENGSDDEEDTLKSDELDETIEPVYEIEITEETEEEGAIQETEVTDEAATTADHAEKQEKNVDEVTHMRDMEHMKHREEELHESLVATRKKLQTLVAENKNKTEELQKVSQLVEEFKGAENEYKTAIKNLKGQLQEVALFTSNLTYAVKLMTENSTTKDEKLDILKRFDSAKTLSESREIFNSMENLFSTSKNTVEKTIEETVLKGSKTSGASNLNESTAYQNPQLSRMLDIIGKIK
jgi:hypothetical protein